MLWILLGSAIVGIVLWIVGCNVCNDNMELGGRLTATICLIVALVMFGFGNRISIIHALEADAYVPDETAATLVDTQEIIPIYQGADWLLVNRENGKTNYYYSYLGEDGYICSSNGLPSGKVKIKEINDGSTPRVETYEIVCRLSPESYTYKFNKWCLFFVPEHIQTDTDVRYIIYVPATSRGKP